MTTHFITAEIALQETPADLQQTIEKELQKKGNPLRWAITQVNEDAQTVQIEAVVTTEN